MIFAPIIGVNHHGQTIVFGCAFLSDETFDWFVWLLKTWLRAMPRGAPNVIITDQDQAMTKAIAHILPNTFHRYYSLKLWKEVNRQVMNGSKKMFELRSTWIPAYVNKYFSAGML
ncbi:hypothetical protein M0R45_009090 [Rubus argutus]|uniref:MULE transposase domain-containing protein n=1 Tax=Rubus argutus TaxID=59490 RepID=A0AAW1Y6G5_RUBAR